MAIKEVDMIPEVSRVITKAQFEYTNKVDADIKYAYRNNIKRFELVGYDKPNYLAECARQVALKFITDILYNPTYKEVKTILQAEFPDKQRIHIQKPYLRYQNTASDNLAIQVYGRTIDGEKRVFVEIDYDYIANFKQNFLTKMRELNRKYRTEVLS